MLDESVPLPSIKDADELRQRTAFCKHFLVTEEYDEFYCDGRTLRVMPVLDDAVDFYDLVVDLNYYEAFPACIEDWADAIAGRLVDESTMEFAERERDEVHDSLAKALTSCPDAVRALIGTVVIEEDYFGLLEDSDGKGLLDDYFNE